MVHWLDELLDAVRGHVRDKDGIVVNGGLSVSGLQHVGRLRGEIVLGHAIARALRDGGRTVTQMLVQYTQDQWKGTDWQLSQFPGESGREHVGRRLIDVPDPHGCHGNWVDHYWEEFSEHLPSYAPEVQVTSTTDVYRRPDMKALVVDLASRPEEVRRVVNKYRPRRPYPEGWIPFEPYCQSCRRVGSASATSVTKTDATYTCECGDEGSSPIEFGKLNWRLEWPALWKIMHVDIEPFGKDHAAPGGSRDSCKEIAETVMGFRPPFGIPYEWVGLGERGVDRGDMGSSDAVGFGPGTWAAVGSPEVLRYHYLSVPPSRRILLDLSRTDAMHDSYDQAEAAHYGDDAGGDPELGARTFVLAAVREIPRDRSFVLPYRHAAYLSQIAPREGAVDWVVSRLRETGVLDHDPTGAEVQGISRRLAWSRRWVDRHAAENRVALLDQLTDDVRSALTAEDREALRRWADAAKDIPWREDEIKESMVALTRGGDLPVPTSAFFRALYRVLLGTDRGPRAAPFLAVLDRTWVLDRVRDATR